MNWFHRAGLNRARPWRQLVAMTNFIVLWAALAASPNAELADRPWELDLGLSGSLAADTRGLGGAASLAVSRRFFGWVRPLAGFGVGARGPGELLNLIRFGVRLELPWERSWRPFLGLAFAHNHETDFAHVRDAPLAAALGLSDHGTNHRSGLDTTLGVSVALPSRPDAGATGVAGVSASVAAMAGTGPVWTVALNAWVGLAF